MTSLERVLAALAGKPADRRAVAPVLSLYGARLTDCPLEQYYTDAAAYARGQAAVRERFQPDVLCAPFDFASIGAAFGGELHFFPDQPPNLRRPAARTAEECCGLAWPDPCSHPRLVYLREAIRQTVAGLRGQAPVAAILPAPMDVPGLILGIETWLETILFDEEGARRVMDKVAPWYVDLVNHLFEDGAAFAVVTCGFASPAVVTREIVGRLARPALEQTLAQLRGPVVLHHVGAPLLAHLDLLMGLPAVAGFALDELDSLERARGITGPEPVLLGGPSGLRLAQMSAEQIGGACRGVLENRQADARFILCSTGPDIPLATPPENVQALRLAAETFAGVAT